ncbi:hypothetical protein M8494_38105 [Serratia ureilytica]
MAISDAAPADATGKFRLLPLLLTRRSLPFCLALRFDLCTSPVKDNVPVGLIQLLA